MVQWLVLGGMVLVVMALVAAWMGEVFGINGRLDAADEEERQWQEDWLWPCRIDQRRD